MISTKNIQLLSALLLTFIINGCTTHLGPKTSFNGGYTDRKIDDYIYVIDYTGAIFSTYDDVTSKLHLHASELCESDNYSHDIKTASASRVTGIIYCNSGFIDTRLQVPEENFQAAINIDPATFEYNELSPLYNLLITKKYSKLNTQIKIIFEKYKNNTINERNLKNILDTFSRVNPELENRISQWITHSPKSSISLYARSLYNYNFAWQNRGNGFWDDLLAGQKQKYKKHLSLAKKDIELAIKLDPSISIFHALNIRIDDKKSVATQSYTRANTHVKNSFMVNAAYMRHLLPRWSGSLNEMNNFINDNVNNFKENPQLEQLQAFIHIEQGDQFLFKNKYNKALEHYNKALATGKISNAYHQRAIALSGLKRYIEAISNYQSSIKLSPYSKSAHIGLMNTYLKTNALGEALKVSSFLVTMDSTNSYNHYIQGNIFYAIRRYNDALNSYLKAYSMNTENLLYAHKIKLSEFQLEVRKADKSQTRYPSSI